MIKYISNLGFPLLLIYIGPLVLNAGILNLQLTRVLLIHLAYISLAALPLLMIVVSITHFAHKKLSQLNRFFIFFIYLLINVLISLVPIFIFNLYKEVNLALLIIILALFSAVGLFINDQFLVKNRYLKWIGVLLLVGNIIVLSMLL